MTLSGATTLGYSGPGSDGNDELLCIPQSSSITGTSPSDCLVSYPVYVDESIFAIYGPRQFYVKFMYIE